MSENSDNFPEHEEGAEFFVDSEIFADDPLLLDIIDQIDSRKDGGITELTTFLDSLNDQFQDNDWIGSRVKLTGKLRLDSWSDKSEFFKDLGKAAQGMRIDEDTVGRYLLADDLEMVMSYLTSDVEIQDEDSTDTIISKAEARVAFSFDTTTDAALKRDDEGGGHLEAGEYIMYPDDILQIKFQRPSLNMVRRTLELEYPRIAAMLRLGEGNPPRSDRALLDRLRDISFGRGLEIPLAIRQGIGRVIYEDFQIDRYAPYEIVLAGEIYGIAEHEGLVPQHTKIGEKLHAGIVGVDMILHGGEWIPHLLVAEPAAESDGYEGILIPISSVGKLVNTRPRRRRFGQVAMLGFSEAEHIYQYWLGFQDEELVSDERAEHESEEQGEYAEFENQLSGVEPPYIDEARGLIIQPLASEVGSLLQTYQGHAMALDDRRGDGAQNVINSLLEESLVDSKELKIGDIIEISGGPEVLHVKEHLTEPCKLEDGMLLRGKFSGIVEAVFPTSRPAKRQAAPFLSLVMRDVELDDSDVSSELFEDSIILVKVVNAHYPHVAKLTPVNSAKSE